LLSRLPRNELKRIRDELIDQYYVERKDENVMAEIRVNRLAWS
jgi:hypothetical protein